MAKFGYGDRVLLPDGSSGMIVCELLDYNSYEVEVDDKYDEFGLPFTMEVNEHDLSIIPDYPIYEEV